MEIQLTTPNMPTQQKLYLTKIFTKYLSVNPPTLTFGLNSQVGNVKPLNKLFNSTFSGIDIAIQGENYYQGYTTRNIDEEIRITLASFFVTGSAKLKQFKFTWDSGMNEFPWAYIKDSKTGIIYNLKELDGSIGLDAEFNTNDADSSTPVSGGIFHFVRNRYQLKMSPYLQGMQPLLFSRMMINLPIPQMLEE